MSEEILLMGFGNMGRIHAKALENLGKKVSIFDPRFSNGDRVPSHITVLSPNIPPKYEDFSHVVIATPIETHGRLIRKILETTGNTRILAEKPGVTSLHDLDLIDSPRVSVGVIERHNPVVRFLARVISQDFPLEISFSRISLGSSHKNGMDLFKDLGLHDIDLLHFLFPDTRVKINQCNSKDGFLSLDLDVHSSTPSGMARFIWAERSQEKRRRIAIRFTDFEVLADLIEQKVFVLDRASQLTQEFSIPEEELDPASHQMKDFLRDTRADTFQSHKTFLDVLHYEASTEIGLEGQN